MSQQISQAIKLCAIVVAMVITRLIVTQVMVSLLALASPTLAALATNANSMHARFGGGYGGTSGGTYAPSWPPYDAAAAAHMAAATAAAKGATPIQVNDAAATANSATGEKRKEPCTVAICPPNANCFAIDKTSCSVECTAGYAILGSRCVGIADLDARLDHANRLAATDAAQTERMLQDLLRVASPIDWRIYQMLGALLVRVANLHAASTGATTVKALATQGVVRAKSIAAKEPTVGGPAAAGTTQLDDGQRHTEIPNTADQNVYEADIDVALGPDGVMKAATEGGTSPEESAEARHAYVTALRQRARHIMETAAALRPRQQSLRDDLRRNFGANVGELSKSSPRQGVWDTASQTQVNNAPGHAAADAGTPPPPALRLNLGAGAARYQGFLNVDKFSSAEVGRPGAEGLVPNAPFLQFDVETFPWPWSNDSVVEVQLIHVLEHIGCDGETFLRIMQELYRVCRHDAVIRITVPHHAHDNFFSDPTHCRPVTRMTLDLFSRALNNEWREKGASNSRFAHALGVDFTLLLHGYDFEDTSVTRTYAEKLNSGQKLRNGITQSTFLLRVIKTMQGSMGSKEEELIKGGLDQEKVGQLGTF